VAAATSVVLRDFEQVAAPPVVWVVNIPNENASVKVTTEQPCSDDVPDVAALQRRDLSNASG